MERAGWAFPAGLELNALGGEVEDWSVSSILWSCGRGTYRYRLRVDECVIRNEKPWCEEVGDFSPCIMDVGSYASFAVQMSERLYRTRNCKISW